MVRCSHLDHRTVDSKHNIITYATAGNVHDSIPYLGRLDRRKERFDLDIKAVGLDAGYASAPIVQGLEERDVLGVTGYLRPSGRKGMLRKREFTYDPGANIYRCPEGQALPYATTDREGYRHYKSDPAKCRDCPRLVSCPTNPKEQKTLSRHIWADARERTDANRLTEWGKRLYARRKNRRTIIRRRKTTLRPPICPLSRSHRCQMAMPTRCNSPEHQEDRNRHGRKVQNQPRMKG